MKRYQLDKKRGNTSFLAGILILMLFLCRDTMISSAIVGFYKAQFLTLGLMALVGVWFLLANFRKWKQILKDSRLLLLVAASFVCLLPVLLKRDWQLMYFSVLVCILFGIFLTYLADWKVLAKWYVVTMAMLGVYSVLAAYVLRLGVDSGAYQVPTFTNGAGFLFHNFLFSVVPDTYVKSRNFGIFREPGVYQFFLLLGLYLNNDAVQWEKSWQQWAVNAILAVTMVTTFATGGVIEMGLLAVLLFFDKQWYRDRKLRMGAGVLVLGALAVAAYCILTKNGLYWSVYDMLIGKFQGDNETGSDRILSITVNLRTFLESPLVGKKLNDVLHSVQNNTSSTMLLLAGFGVLSGGLHLAGWLALVWRNNRKSWVNLAYFGILLLSFNTQNLIADVFLWLFPMMALTDSVVCLWDKRKGENHGS